MACGILVPHPGIKPFPPELAGQSLKYRTTREAPKVSLWLRRPHQAWLWGQNCPFPPETSVLYAYVSISPFIPRHTSNFPTNKPHEALRLAKSSFEQIPQTPSKGPSPAASNSVVLWSSQTLSEITSRGGSRTESSSKMLSSDCIHPECFPWPQGWSPASQVERRN